MNYKPETAALELATQRELAIRAIDAVSEVLESDVSIDGLVKTIAHEEASPVTRLGAKRALRCIASIATDPEVMRVVGEDGVYAFAEGVVMYGARDSRYLDLMKEHNLTADEATGLYALRALVGEQANNVNPSFQQLLNALSMVAMSVQQAASNPDEALEAFDEAGFFSDHSDHKQFNAAKFDPQFSDAHYRVVEHDADGTITQGIKDGVQEHLRRPSEESEEDDSWHRDAAKTEFLKNLVF